ncbi:9416_t:CDS:1, partial [Acaulospora colombiana]
SLLVPIRGFSFRADELSVYKKMNESKILLLICITICLSFLGLVSVGIEQWSQYKEYEGTPKLPTPPTTKEPSKKISYDAVSLIASAVSAMTNSQVLTYYNYLERDQADIRVYEQLDFNVLYKSRLVGGPVATRVENNSLFNQSSSFEVKVHTLTNQELLIKNVTSGNSVYELKKKIKDILGAAPRIQRLVFNGQRLLNEKYLGLYNINANSIIHLEIQSKDDFETIKFINPDFEKHIYFDKGKHNDRCGWKKIAPLSSYAQNNLNVANDWSEEQEVEIQDNKGKRKWKISYHGTERYHHRSIADDGYIASRRYHNLGFSHGIYTTPDIKVASSYAKKFAHNGTKFEILFQNLVNSEISVELPTHRMHNKYWISPDEDDVKLHGILIRNVDDC